jgi:hypothetical protein
MEWIQSIGIIFAVFGMFKWNRTESVADMRHMDAKLDASSKENRDLIDASAKENRDLIDASTKENRELIAVIHQEMKDFHGRLCAIEERRK